MAYKEKDIRPYVKLIVEKEIASALAEGVQVLAMVRKFKEFENEK